MRGQSNTEIAQMVPAHGYQWNREGHPFVIQRGQVPTKIKDRRAKTECQSREEWGHHAPNRKAMETSSKDRARTSHSAGRCRVEGAGAGGTRVSGGVTLTAVRDHELTGKAETRNASSGLVKQNCSRGGTLRT